jgi:hypothetical protein
MNKRCQTKPLNILIWSIIEKERTGNEKGIEWWDVFGTMNK